MNRFHSLYFLNSYAIPKYYFNNNSTHLNFTYFIFRHMQLTYFFLKNGKTIDLFCPTIWRESIDYCPLNGYIWYGDPILSSRMPKKSHFKRWQYQIIMYGCTKIKQFSTWSSKYEYFHLLILRLPIGIDLSSLGYAKLM